MRSRTYVQQESTNTPDINRAAEFCSILRESTHDGQHALHRASGWRIRERCVTAGFDTGPLCSVLCFCRELLRCRGPRESAQRIESLSCPLSQDPR